MLEEAEAAAELKGSGELVMNVNATMTSNTRPSVSSVSNNGASDT